MKGAIAAANVGGWDGGGVGHVDGGDARSAKLFGGAHGSSKFGHLRLSAPDSLAAAAPSPASHARMPRPNPISLEPWAARSLSLVYLTVLHLLMIA